MLNLKLKWIEVDYSDYSLWMKKVDELPYIASYGVTWVTTLMERGWEVIVVCRLNT